jgi:hypothetical protein
VTVAAKMTKKGIAAVTFELISPPITKNDLK